MEPLHPRAGDYRVWREISTLAPAGQMPCGETFRKCFRRVAGAIPAPAAATRFLRCFRPVAGAAPAPRRERRPRREDTIRRETEAPPHHPNECPPRPPGRADDRHPTGAIGDRRLAGVPASHNRPTTAPASDRRPSPAEPTTAFDRFENRSADRAPPPAPEFRRGHGQCPAPERRREHRRRHSVWSVRLHPAKVARAGHSKGKLAGEGAKIHPDFKPLNPHSRQSDRLPGDKSVRQTEPGASALAPRPSASQPRAPSAPTASGGLLRAAPARGHKPHPLPPRASLGRGRVAKAGRKRQGAAAPRASAHRAAIGSTPVC